VNVHGKRSEVILFVFNMYLQQGGHRQKTTDKLMKIKTKQKKIIKYISYQCRFPTFFFSFPQEATFFFLSKETLQYKETYEGTSYFTTRDI